MTTPTSPLTILRKAKYPPPYKVLITIALIAATALLVSNLFEIPDQLHAYLASLPLFLAGIAYAVLQFRARPRRVILLKRLLLAASFVAWAIVQLLPAGRLATIIGDLVVGVFVLDLYWIVQEQASTAQ